MKLENVLGLKCELIGRGLFSHERVVSVKGKQFIVPKDSVKFTSDEREECYVSILDFPCMNEGLYLATIFSEGNCYVNLWCSEEDLVFS